MKYLLSILIFITIFSSCTDDSAYTDKNYPTSIQDLGDADLDELYNIAYNIGLYDCISIDYQGRMVQYANSNLCEINDTTPANFTVAEIEYMSKFLVAQNESLFGVRDTSEMELLQILAENGVKYENFFTADTIEASPYWRVLFNHQNIDNIDVLGTELQFIVDSYGVVSASGKWYSNIYIPSIEVVSEIEAQTSLYGIELSYGNTRFTPEENSTWFESKKIIFPVYKSGELQFHVCWAVYPESWEVIIDTQNGEILSMVNIDSL